MGRVKNSCSFFLADFRNKCSFSQYDFAFFRNSGGWRKSEKTVLQDKMCYQKNSLDERKFLNKNNCSFQMKYLVICEQRRMFPCEANFCDATATVAQLLLFILISKCKAELKLLYAHQSFHQTAKRSDLKNVICSCVLQNWVIKRVFFKLFTS